jgi:hypothetical protein
MLIPSIPGIGIRFDIDKLGKLPSKARYDFPAWAIIWRHVNVMSIRGAFLHGGDTLREGENVYVAALQCPNPAQIQMVRGALVRADDYWRVAALLPFLEGPALEREPLVPYGQIAMNGTWKGEDSVARDALSELLPDSGQLDHFDWNTFQLGQQTLRAYGALQSGKISIFLSYARKDREFADWLHDSLKSAGVDVSRDISDTLPGEEWWKRLKNLIAAADTVVFVVSPHAIQSSVCADEVAYAQSLSKRIFPVVCEDVDWNDVPGSLSKTQSISFTDPGARDTALASLVTSLRTDIDWIREHTRLLDRAQTWLAMDRAESELLKGRALALAEQWLNMRPATGEGPSALHTEYILASRQDDLNNYQETFNAANRREAHLRAALSESLRAPLQEMGQALDDERSAQLLMAMGLTEQGISAYRRSLQRVEGWRSADPASPTNAMLSVILNWVLASYGDDAISRFERIVATLRELKGGGKLNVDQENLLPEAEARLSGLRLYGLTR